MRTVLGILSLLWKVHIFVVFVATTLLFYPIIFPLLFSDKNKKRAFKIFVVWSWSVRILCGYFVMRKKVNPVPNEPFILLANHSSYLDIFLMYSIFPRHPFLFLGKSEILSYPLIKTFFKRLNIPVHRSNHVKAARSLVTAAKEMKKGWSLVIFPEGGIPDDNNPKMIEFKEGAFQLAKSMRVPIVPVTFTNNYRLFSDPSHLLGYARPGISHVYIHETITSEEVDRLSKAELKAKCFQIIQQPLLELYPELHQE